MFNNHPRYEARSAGTADSARVKITPGHLGWADLIFCMERKHAELLRERFVDELEGKKLITLRIPDDYRFMDPVLVELLRAALDQHVDL